MFKGRFAPNMEFWKWIEINQIHFDEKYTSLSAWKIRINIILVMNFQKKLLSNNLKLLECVTLKLESLSVPVCFPMSPPCYIFKLLSFFLLPELDFWHKLMPAAGVSLSSPFTSSYLERWRVQSRGICEQDTLGPWSSELQSQQEQDSHML